MFGYKDSFSSLIRNQTEDDVSAADKSGGRGSLAQNCRVSSRRFGSVRLPTLWTMSRYNLNVCVVICNNFVQHLKHRERDAKSRRRKQDKLVKIMTSLGDPAIDWVAMAKSFGFRMATRCDTIESFQMVFQEAMEKSGRRSDIGGGYYIIFLSSFIFVMCVF